jgi:hypothetical protein
MWDSRQEKKKEEDDMDRQQQSEREYIYAEAYNGATVRIPKDRYHEWKATQDKLRAGEEVPEVKETAKKLAALMRGEEPQNESKHNKKQEETECRVEEKPKQNDWDQKIMSIITSQRIAAVFSLLLCISLYFSLLSTVFTQKIDTYVVFTQEDSNVIHGSMGCTGKVDYINRKKPIISTTLHECPDHTPCSMSCMEKAKETTITVKDYLSPLCISLPISVGAFMILTFKRKPE